MAERESIGRTLLVAGGVALFCSLIVSSAVYWLRPIQRAYETIDRNRSILMAAGIASPGAALTDTEIVSQFLQLDILLVNLDTGETVAADDDTARRYDYVEASADPERSRAIDTARDLSGLGRRPLLMPVYLWRQGSRVERVVLPVFGRGMWSTIYAYVGLESDLVTIAGVDIFMHGETPGIGDRIQNPGWTAQWRGKRAFDDAGAYVLRIGSSGAAAQSASAVDAITGATVTVSAVDRIVAYWFGPDGYEPFLRRVRPGGSDAQ